MALWRVEKVHLSVAEGKADAVIRVEQLWTT